MEKERGRGGKERRREREGEGGKKGYTETHTHVVTRTCTCTGLLRCTQAILNILGDKGDTHAANPGEELPVTVHNKGLELNCDSSNCGNLGGNNYSHTCT